MAFCGVYTTDILANTTFFILYLPIHVLWSTSNFFPAAHEQLYPWPGGFWVQFSPQGFGEHSSISEHKLNRCLNFFIWLKIHQNRFFFVQICLFYTKKLHNFCLNIVLRILKTMIVSNLSEKCCVWRLICHSNM